MTRSYAQSPARRLSIVGLCLIASLVVATGLAWACVPSGGVTAATPASGPAGTVTNVTGDGASTATEVEIRWGSRTGPMLIEDVPVNTTSNPRSFSAQVTVPATASPGLYYLVVIHRNAAGQEVDPPQGQVATFHVTDPAVALAPASGPSGSSTTVTATNFAAVPVKVRWDSPNGPVLGSATGPDFTKRVTIPAGAIGSHSIFAVPSINSADRASAVFRITAPLLPALSTPVDKTGPAIAAAALARQNRSRTVSRRGVVRLFCGRFTEEGVEGRCGARSTRALRLRVRASGRAVRSVVLRLAAKRFRAAPGRPVMLRFRLSRAGLKLLKGAKRVRMLGTVDARDAAGNPTKVPFRFTLKAPKPRAN